VTGTNHARLEDSTPEKKKMKITVFWDVTPCTLIGHWEHTVSIFWAEEYVK
jgi:hypothetical protein